MCTGLIRKITNPPLFLKMGAYIYLGFGLFGPEIALCCAQDDFCVRCPRNFVDTKSKCFLYFLDFGPYFANKSRCTMGLCNINTSRCSPGPVEETCSDQHRLLVQIQVQLRAFRVDMSRPCCGGFCCPTCPVAAQGPV